MKEANMQMLKIQDNYYMSFFTLLIIPQKKFQWFQELGWRGG